MSEPLLAASNLCLRRGGRELLGGLDLALCRGDYLWLTGPNGAGKTSLLRILAGLLTPDSGHLSWRGEEFAARLDEPTTPLAYLDERMGLNRDLSLEQNWRYFAQIHGQAMDESVFGRLQLAPLRHRGIRQLSLGQQRRAAFGRILLSGAMIWLLDEPMNALDSASRERLAVQLTQHLTAGGTVVVASHDALPLRGAAPRMLELGA